MGMRPLPDRASSQSASDYPGSRATVTGGSIHFIINNQIGFTTNPRHSRSSPYCSDVARMIEAPIFHVNGDDPEAVVHVAKIATEFRQKFQQAGRHRHVLLSPLRPQREPTSRLFTQPRMYRKIKSTSDSRHIAIRSQPQLTKA